MSLDGTDILRSLVDYKGFVKLHSRLRKEDAQSADLMRDVWDQLTGELELSRGAQEALSRLMGICSRGANWDVALLRNNIFKAAHSLGMRLPSAMFASDLSAQWGVTVRDFQLRIGKADYKRLKQFKHLKKRAPLTPFGGMIWDVLVVSGNFGPFPRSGEFNPRELAKTINKMEMRARGALDSAIRRVIGVPFDGDIEVSDDTETYNFSETYDRPTSRWDPGMTEDFPVDTEVTCPTDVRGTDTVSVDIRGVVKAIDKAARGFGYVIDRRFIEQGDYETVLVELAQELLEGFEDIEIKASSRAEDKMNNSLDYDVSVSEDIYSDAGCSVSDTGYLLYVETDEIEVDGWNLNITRNINFSVQAGTGR